MEKNKDQVTLLYVGRRRTNQWLRFIFRASLMEQQLKDKAEREKKEKEEAEKREKQK